MQNFDYEVYEGNDLGAVYTPKMTRFKVWAPEAEAVNLRQKGSLSMKQIRILLMPSRLLMIMVIQLLFIQ